MTNSRKKATRKGAADEGTAGNPESDADLQAALWALTPSADQLERLAAGAHSASPPQSLSSANLAPSHDPRAFLNPLASLPQPLSLDEVRASLRCADTRHCMSTK